jgi:tripartite-type tricarboxylate transporter receptor subunit TctC
MNPTCPNGKNIMNRTVLPRLGFFLPFRNMARLAAAALGVATVLASSGARADDVYPSRTIKLVVPFAAGGGTDIQARMIAQELGKVLGQSVIVENHPGAGGNIGAKYVATSPADGYTLLVGSTGTHAANQFLYATLPYDPVKDFAPVTLLSTFDNVLVVPQASPVKTIQDLVAMAKKSPGKLNYGVTTIGSSSHLAVEKFKRDAGIEASAVPYNGAGQATTDLLGGRLDFMLDLVGTQIGNIQAGKVRPIATTAAKRNAVLKDVPTIAESGYPGFSAVGWNGLFAPAATPPAVVEKVYEAIKQAYASPEFQASMRARSFDIAAMPPKEYAQFLQQERAKWGAVIQEAHIKLD